MRHFPLHPLPILAALLFCCSLIIPARAQIFEQTGAKPTSLFSGGSYYNFSSGSGCDLRASIWGYVRNPGRYLIPCETNLIELLSFAGGPQEGAYLNKVMIVRRGGAEKLNDIKEVILIDVQKYLAPTKVSSPAIDLLLLPGDLVVLDGEPVHHYDLISYMQILVTLTTTVTAAVALINLFKK